MLPPDGLLIDGRHIAAIAAVWLGLAFWLQGWVDRREGGNR